MDYKTSHKLFSTPRMRKYANACAGNRQKTMQLYRYNLRLCQRFYGILNVCTGGLSPCAREITTL